MNASSLLGRRIHIAGSISDKPSVAPKDEVARARKCVELLVPRLVKRGATFVLPIDDEKTREADGLPICFDWLVLRTLDECVHLRPQDAPEPYVVAVRHHKSEGQVPTELTDLWRRFRDSGHVEIRDVGHWNLYSKRMEAQASHGDILIALGGKDGVLNLANLYHDAGKPVVPLNIPITPKGAGAQKLFDDIGLSQFNANRLFRLRGQGTAHEWMGKVDFNNSGRTNEQQTNMVLKLLEDLDAPHAFVVRLMNDGHSSYSAVEELFSQVISPVVEEEYGYRIAVVDGSQPYDSPTIQQDIFEKLHRSQLALVDLTGVRPNCLIELGYALGRGLPTMLLAQKGERAPFDIQGVPIYYWEPSDSVEERQEAFRLYWKANIRRPPLVCAEALIE